MRTTLLLLLIITSVISVRAEVNIDSIIGHITAVQLRHNPKASFYQCKSKFKFSDIIKINQKSDTIFLCESDLDGMEYTVEIWNKSQGYLINNIGTSDVNLRPIHWRTEIEYINRWDVDALLKAGSSPVIVKPPLPVIKRKDVSYVQTTRIIIHNGYASFESLGYFSPWFPEDYGH